MISSILFSKDRSIQCDLCLRSIKENLKEINELHVLYKSTTEDFKCGYNKLMSKYHDIYWYPESDFKRVFLNIINDFKNDFILNFVDDTVVIRKPDLNTLFSEFSDDVTCINLKIGKNLNYCHSANLSMETPEFIKIDPVLKWNWTKQDPRIDFGYPNGIDSIIYRTKYFKKLVNECNFSHPNALEGEMNNRRNLEKPCMISEKKSIILNIPNNLTQTAGATPHGNKKEYSLEELNKKYLDGYIIDTKNIYEINNTSAQQEVDYKFIKG